MAIRHLDTPEAHVPTRLLGRTGCRISGLVLGLGGWRSTMPGTDARDIVDAYLAAGGRTFEVSDAAEGMSERLAREALLERHAREDVVVVARSGRHGAGPFGAGHDTSRAGLMRGLDATLARLGSEHVDLWLVDGLDGVTPVGEVAGTMEWALTSGRATHVGISGVEAWQAVDLAHALRSRGVTLTAHAQEHHLLARDAGGALDAAEALGYGFVAGAGLSRGVLTGKYRHGTPPDSRRAAGDLTATASTRATAGPVVESLVTAAEGLGVHPSELALAWQLQTPGVDAVMVGVRTPAQLRVAVRAGVLNVPGEILAALDEVSTR